MMAEEQTRYLQLKAFVFGPALDIIHLYFESKVLHNTDLYLFLNKTDNKHILFHEYIPAVACCECSKKSFAAPNKRGCLLQSQYFLLFQHDLSCNVNHEIRKGKDIAQYCLCQYSAKVSVTVDVLDITLISAIIQKCCPSGSIPGNPNWMKNIKEVRNYVSHNGSCETAETEFQIKWNQLEKAVLGYAGVIGTSCAKQFKRQIDRLQRTHNDELKEIIKESCEYLVKEIRNDKEGTAALIIESSRTQNTLLERKSEDIKNHVSSEMHELQDIFNATASTSAATVKEEFKKGMKHVSIEASRIIDINERTLKKLEKKLVKKLDRKVSKKMGELKETFCSLQNHIYVNERPKIEPPPRMNGQYNAHEGQKVKLEVQVDSTALDEKKTIERLTSANVYEEEDKYVVESAVQECILLTISAIPDILEDEESLHSAIRSIIERIVVAGEIDTTQNNKMDVTLTITSTISNEQKRIVYSMLSKYGVAYQHSSGMEEESSVSDGIEFWNENLSVTDSLNDDVAFNTVTEPVEHVQITVNNIEFEVKVKGFPKEKENEKIICDSETESETLYVHWTLDCPKDWNLRSIKETMKNMVSKYVGCFRVDVFHIDMFDRLSLDTATQRNVVNTFLCMELEIKTFLEQIVESCQIKSETISDVSVIVTILPGAYKNEDDTDVDELTEDDYLVKCRNCKYTFVCTKCTKMAKKMAALKTILYLKEKNIEDLQADLKNTDTTNKEDAKGSETEGSEFETEEDILKEPLNKKKKRFEDTITTGSECQDSELESEEDTLSEPGFKKKQSIQHLGVTSSEDKDVDHMDVSGIFIDRARHKIDSWNTKLNLLQSQKQECFKLAGLPQLDRLIKNSFSYYQSRYVSKRLFLDPIWERLTKIERQIRGKIRNYKGVIEEESKTTTDTDQDQICNMNLKSLITCSLCKTIDEKNIMAWCKTCSKLMCSSCVLIHLTNTTDHSIEYDKDYLRGYKYKSQIAVNMVNILNVHAIHAIQCVNSSILTVFHERMHGVPNFAVFGFDGNKKHDFELSGFNSMFDLSFIVPITDDLVVVTHDTASHMEIINYTNGSILNRIPTHREAGEEIKGVAFISNQLIVGFSNGIDILNMSGGKVSRIDLKDVQILRSVGNGKLFCRHLNQTSSDIINSYIDIPNNTISTLADFKCNPTDITIDDEGNIIFVQNGVVYQADYSGHNSKIIITSGTSVRCVSWENSSKTLCITHFDSSFYHSSHAIYMYSKD